MLIFQKICYSGIIPSVYLGKEEIDKFIQYEFSMTVHMDRITNQRKVTKLLLFKTTSQNH